MMTQEEIADLETVPQVVRKQVMYIYERVVNETTNGAVSFKKLRGTQAIHIKIEDPESDAMRSVGVSPYGITPSESRGGGKSFDHMWRSIMANAKKIK